MLANMLFCWITQILIIFVSHHQFAKNAKACKSIVQEYCVSEELPRPARFEQICAICICAEQTFSQAKVNGEDFSPAFAIAMEAYMNGELRGEVIKEIQVNAKLEDEFELSGAAVTSLVEILKAHRLRL